MKTFLKVFAILFITSFIISCNNNDDDSSTPTTSGYFLKAKIDGVDYSATNFQVVAGKRTDGGIHILSTNTAVGTFEFDVENVASVGTYPTTSVGSNPFARMVYGDGSGLAYSPGFCGTTGFLTITSLSSTEIEGTFSFTVTTGNGACPRPTKTITEGTFKSRYSPI